MMSSEVILEENGSMIKSAVGALQVAPTSHGAELPQLPPGTQHGSGIAEVYA